MSVKFFCRPFPPLSQKLHMGWDESCESQLSRCFGSSTGKCKSALKIAIALEIERALD